MDNSTIDTLEERRCMALADFYLGQVAPNDAVTAPLKLTSFDDLYHYLLLDSQVGKELETSQLAEGTASLQQYIGAIYGGLQAGHTEEFSNDELIAWHQRYCNISDWAGYQMLLDYAENWINPSMRLRKSDSFKELVDNLGQASLSASAVQTALFEHLKKFEEVCNLDLKSAYIDSIVGTGGKKGEGFKNADYYFLGRQRVQPFGYFWRKAHVELNDKSTFLAPAAWTEWKPVDIPAAENVLAIRPVFFAGRLMVVQVEGNKAQDIAAKDNDGNEIIVEGSWQIDVKLSYLAVNGTWSTPQSLGKKEFAQASEASARLVVVTYGGARKHVDDRLGVCFTTTDLPPARMDVAEDEKEHGWIFAEINSLFESLVPNIANLKVLANGRFSDQSGLQHKLLLSEAAVLTQSLVPAPGVAAVGDTREGILSKFISLNINFSSQQTLVKGVLETNNLLQVQGVCDLTRPEYELKDLVLVVKETVKSATTYFELSRVGTKGVKLTCFRWGGGFDFSLCLDDEDAKPVVIETFKTTEFAASDGWASVKKNIVLTPRQLETLWQLSSSAIRGGAGFSVLIGDVHTSLTDNKNALSMLKKPETVGLALKIMDGNGVVPGQWAETKELTGWNQSPWIQYRWTGSPVGKKLSVVWGEDADGRYGRDRYDIEIKQVPNASNAPLISKQSTGAQFLDVRPLGIPDLHWIRLNSLFGLQLVAKAAISIDAVLSLDTQNTEEPSATGENPASVPLDFNSAHGTFYWELFFHLPFLIAHRLCEERNYLESQRWYHYIFNPHIRMPREGEKEPNERYWQCRVLLEEGKTCFEAKGLLDPDAIAFSNRIHYRKAIFMGYVRCIIAHADSLYRRLTRDDLAAAKLQYVRALSLMGPAPSAKAMSHWAPKSAFDILKPDPAAGASALDSFARSIDVDVANLPARVEGTPDFELIKIDELRPFTNEQLLDTWKYIEECLWNMRHNLTIDGKPMTMSLYAQPTNPLELLRAQAGGSSGATRNAGGWKNIPHYRFRTLLPTAKDAAQTLIGFGREVLRLMESRDRGQVEELQQSHVIALGAHAKTIQEETIKQQEASLEGLKQSQAMIQQRVDHYENMNRGGLLGLEIEGDALSLIGKTIGAVAIVPRIAAAVADSAPNIGGTSVGGMRFGASLDAAGLALTIAGATAYAGGEIAQRSAYYLRRAQEWQFAAAQANSELRVIEEQLTAQEYALNAARASLIQTQKANDQAQELFTFFKTRATNVELFRWLLSQMATVYFQAYDAVLSLCFAAESSFQYEMGDYNQQVIRPNSWMDNRHGLTAGEGMLLDLMRLDRMFLERNERRLELEKTVSLRQLFEQGKFVPEIKTWEDVIRELKTGKIRLLSDAALIRQ